MNNFPPRLCFHSQHRSSQRPISSLWSSRSARLSSEGWTWQRSSQNWHFTCWRRFLHISHILHVQLRKFVHTRNIRTIDWLLSITFNFLCQFPFYEVAHSKNQHTSCIRRGRRSSSGPNSESTWDSFCRDRCRSRPARRRLCLGFEWLKQKWRKVEQIWSTCLESSRISGCLQFF